MDRESNKEVVTRFAPSPTGYFHAGSYRTALFSWIYAKQNKGRFILRIEDTDRERSKNEYEQNIIESLKWLGLEYDEFYRQSDRTDTYKNYINKLIADGHAYISDESEKNEERISVAKKEGKAIDRTQLRPSVIRFKNPNKKVIFEDMIRGKVVFDTTELGDFVIAKSEDEPVFHLVVVVDDYEMGITHVIRGEDHISNTPRQILIYEALGAVIPCYAHIPLLLSADRSKLSKRKGAIPISEYRDKGYVREALINYLSLLGWHPTDDREVMPIDDIISEFSLERVQKAGAIFDEEKLRWFNRQYILRMPDDKFIEQARPFFPEWVVPRSDISTRLIPLLREKIFIFSEITTLLIENGELAFVHKLPDYSSTMLLWKKNPNINITKVHLNKVMMLLQGISDDQDSFSSENIKNIFWPYVEESGKGDVLWPFRIALTGQDRSPDPFVSAAILGKSESLRRIELALGKF